MFTQLSKSTFNHSIMRNCKYTLENINMSDAMTKMTLNSIATLERNPFFSHNINQPIHTFDPL